MATSTHHLTLAKADQEDFNAVLTFMNACELALDAGKFSLHYAYDKWEDLDEDDPVRIEIENIKTELKEEEWGTISNDQVMYEYLRRKFESASSAWRRVYWLAEMMERNVCDPTQDHVALHPCFSFQHVETEQ